MPAGEFRLRADGAAGGRVDDRAALRRAHGARGVIQLRFEVIDQALGVGETIQQALIFGHKVADLRGGFGIGSLAIIDALHLFGHSAGDCIPLAGDG